MVEVPCTILAPASSTPCPICKFLRILQPLASRLQPLYLGSTSTSLAQHHRVLRPTEKTFPNLSLKLNKPEEDWDSNSPFLCTGTTFPDIFTVDYCGNLQAVMTNSSSISQPKQTRENGYATTESTLALLVTEQCQLGLVQGASQNLLINQTFYNIKSAGKEVEKYCPALLQFMHFPLALWILSPNNVINEGRSCRVPLLFFFF